jgi:hypothetical protein
LQVSVSRATDPVQSVNHSHRPTPRRALTFALALSWPIVVGCGNTLYAVQANSASGKLEEARELGAELYAPYEYYYAKEHLQKAQTEAAEADYGDAVELAEESKEYAERALRLTREARRGAVR